MKKLFSLLLVFTLSAGLAGCGGTTVKPGNASSNAGVNSSAEPVAEPMEVRISVGNSATHVIGQGYALFAEKLEELSNGQLKCKIFYDGTYCSNTEALTEMAKENLEVGASGATYIIEYLPQYGFLQMAYLYDSCDHALNVLNGEIGAKIFQDVAEETGVLPLRAYYFGSRNVMLTKDIEVKSPADLASIKMRTNGTESMMHMMKAMNANPVGVALGETYGALQTGVADGQENPIAACIQYNFPEVSKSWTYTEHYIDCTWLACSYSWFQSLTPELQQVVRDAAVVACDFITEEVLKVEETTDDILKEAGVAVYRIDKTPFEEAAAEYYSQFYNEWDIQTMNEILDMK